MVIADPSAASLGGKVSLSLVVVALTAVVYLVFNAGEMLSSRISTSALQVLTKIMGLLLTAIAIQMLFSGLSTGFPILKGLTG